MLGTGKAMRRFAFGKYAERAYALLGRVLPPLRRISLLAKADLCRGRGGRQSRCRSQGRLVPPKPGTGESGLHSEGRRS